MSENGTALAVREQPAGGALAMWDAEQLNVIKDLICPGATDSELALFGQVCQRTGLDPFSKQIYGLMRWDSRKRREVLSIQTSIDGFRLTAQRSGDYAGQEGPLWCGEDGVWRDVWLSKDRPAAAKVGVYRKGWTRPAWGIATWIEYAQTNKDGQVTGLWRNMPANMLAKCAESQALRKAFPAELSGLYSGDEMGQADNAREHEPAAGSDDQRPATWGRNAREQAANSRRVVRDGVVVKDNAGPSGGTDGEHPDPAAQARIRQFESAWARGAAQAQEIGADVPEMPDPRTKSKDELEAALKAFGAAIAQRRAFLDGERLMMLTTEAQQLGIDVEVIDPATLTPEALAGTIEALSKMVADVEAGQEAQADDDGWADA